jgi:multidrug efflux pump subunit AcrB
MIIVGLTSLMTMKRDLIPQWKVKSVQVRSFLPGASPEQIEKFVTSPIEDAISSFAGIKNIKSTSSQGQSSITINAKDELDEDGVVDLYQKIDAKVRSMSSSLPKDIDEIQVTNFKPTSFWFTSLSVLHYDFFNTEHRQWLLATKEKLRKLSGIVEVSDRTSWPAITIKFSPERLARYRLRPDHVAKVVHEHFELVPMGALEQDGETIRIQMNKRITDPTDLNNIIIQGNASGSLVRLKDVAKVSYGFDKITFKSKTNGVDSANIHLFKDFDTDTISLKEKLEVLLKEVNLKTPEGVKLIITGDGPAYVERQLNVLRGNGFLGLILVIFSLFLFLGGRSAIMTSFGLPLAYFATFTVLGSLGISIDIISVVGMILIVGILVDDAIIVSEQYSQYLEAGFPPKEAAMKAVETTMIPITGTVITTIVAFLPILMAKGGLSDFLYAIPWVVIAALAMSWLESFFILPNHLAHFVKKPMSSKNGKFFKRVKSFYKLVLAKVLKWRYVALVAGLAFMVFSLIFSQKNVPMKFNLSIGSEKVRLITALKSSDSIEETEKKMIPIWKMLEKIDTKKYSYISGDIGYAYYNDEIEDDLRFAQIDIRFNQTHEDIAGSKKYILEYLEKNLKSLKTSDFEILKVDKKIEGEESQKENTMSIFVKGRDEVDTESVLDDVKSVALKIPETKTVDIDSKLFVETWEFEINEEALKRYNISSFDLGQQIRSYIQKQEVKEVRHNGRNIKIYTKIDRPEVVGKKELEHLEILGNYGIKIKAFELGKWIKTRSLRRITHIDQEKTLTLNVQFDDKKIKMDAFKKKVEKSLESLQEKNPTVQYSVENANQREEENKSSMTKMLIYCILMILFVLAVVLKSLFQPFLIASAIPFGVIGVILAFYFHGQALEVMAMVGIIGMAGVVVNDSLIMVDTINKRRKSWFDFPRQTIIDGAASRLRAIVLTSVTTLGGVFPMAYGLGGDAGFTKPLALSMGWGLLFATTITLVFIPCLLEIQKDLMLLFYKIIRKKPSQTMKGKMELDLEGPVEIELPLPYNESNKKSPSDGPVVQ